MKKIIGIIFLMLLSIASAVSLDDKISQMIIIGFDGNSVESKDFKNVLDNIDLISGVILFSKNIDNIGQLKEMIKTIKEKSKIVPFIAIDNEGGQVMRFKADVKSAKQISKMTDSDARKEYQKLAKANYETGINLNLAPVVDLEINKNSIIAKKERSYGDNYKTVSKYASILTDEHKKYNIITSLKHFPGHGSVTGDTHKGFVDATKTFKSEELMPYYILKDSDMVMISHIFNSNIDEKYPASLSERTLEILKKDIGFKGVIISDDYDMGAIRDNYSLDKIVIRAINSGVDILLFSNNLNYYDRNIHKKIHKIIKREIKRGTIKQEDIDKSYEKIMKLKMNIK